MPSDRPLRVLIIEGEPLSRAFVTALLEGRGHAVIALATPTEALMIVEDGFDLVLVDCDPLGGIDPATITLIRQTATVSGSRPRIIGLSLDGRQHFAAPDMVCCLDARLTKPLQVAEWCQTLTRLGLDLPGPAGAGPQNPLLGRLLATMQDDSALLQEPLRTFLALAPQLMTALRKAYEDRDMPAVQRHAHRLVGMLGHFQAESLSRLTALIEAEPHAPTVGARIEDLSERLISLCQDVQGWLAAQAGDPPVSAPDSRRT